MQFEQRHFKHFSTASHHDHMPMCGERKELGEIREKKEGENFTRSGKSKTPWRLLPPPPLPPLPFLVYASFSFLEELPLPLPPKQPRQLLLPLSFPAIIALHDVYENPEPSADLTSKKCICHYSYAQGLHTWTSYDVCCTDNRLLRKCLPAETAGC